MGKELYHYCSNIKCFSILKHKNIRLSDIQKSNDYKELSLFFPRIFECLEEQYMQHPFDFTYLGKTGAEAFEEMLDISYHYWRRRFSTGEFSNFVLCFSESADSLSQWRGYADNGKGCCIGFCQEELEKYCSSTNGVLRFEKVIYLEDKDINKVIENAAREILEGLPGIRKEIVENITLDDANPQTDGLLHFNFDGALESSFISSLKYKSAAFKEESEWRMFFANRTYKKHEWISSDENEDFGGPRGFAETIHFLRNKVEFMATDDDLVPYCPIRFDEFENNPISTVWVGPKNNICSSDLDLFLKLNGYPKTEIKMSQISYC